MRVGSSDRVGGWGRRGACGIFEKVAQVVLQHNVANLCR